MNKFFIIPLLALIYVSGKTQSITITDSAHYYTYSGLPYSPTYDYSYGQTIYYESEIQGSGLITGLSFFYLGNNLSHSDSVAFYIGPTDSDYMQYLLKSVPLTKVFDFIVTYSTVPGYITVQLKTPYYYSGIGNLIIAGNELRAGLELTTKLFAGYYTFIPLGKGRKTGNVRYGAPINPNKLDSPPYQCLACCKRVWRHSFHNTLRAYPFPVPVT